MNEDKKRIYRDDLLKLLEELDAKLHGYQRKFKIYAIGGTVLMLDNKIDASKDADFIVSHRDFIALSGHIAEIERKSRIRIDLVDNGDFGDYTYDKYAKHAISVPLPFKHIEVLRIDKPAFVLTKALAGRVHDINDILHYVTPLDVPKTTLEERFQEVKQTPGKEEILQKKLTEFMNVFYLNK